MANLSIVGPGEVESMEVRATRLRVLEDGSTTDHRLGVIELTIAPHTFGNSGDEPVVVLSTVTPDFYIRYFKEMRDWAASGKPMTREAQAEIMSGYATVTSTEHGPEAG